MIQNRNMQCCSMENYVGDFTTLRVVGRLARELRFGDRLGGSERQNLLTAIE